MLEDIEFQASSEIEKFLNKQSGKATGKILREMDFLKKFGLQIMTERKVVKKIHNSPSIYEFRVNIDKIFYRFPFVIRNNKAIFLDGFKKKTNKIELKDKKKAINRAKNI